MHRSTAWVSLGWLVAGAVGCGAGGAAVRSQAERERDSAVAVASLQAARFAEAASQASLVLARDPGNSRAAAVHAIATYQAAGSRLRDDLFSAGMSLLDHATARDVGERFLVQLATVDRDLGVVAGDPAFSLDLCLACWEHDWNHNGEIDDRDRALFEIEFDGRVAPGSEDGVGELPPGDPRRRPTFRFDTGDADWARAMISFQRAALELLLAYRWSEVGKLFAGSRGGAHAPTVVLHLEDAPRVQRARTWILDGMRYADRCRAEYLAETDDTREWVPNPRQHDHPVPLEVDAALYQTWADITGDVRRLLEGEDGISFRELAALGKRDSAAYLPDAYLDLGAMLRQPADITLDLALIEAADELHTNTVAVVPLIEKFLRGALGKGYAPAKQRSPLIGRLQRMKRELSTGNDTFERKLRYLLWLN
ncbi:MAG TPA: hypothetical protein VHT91_02445 [Kofleriaceae bacterium]|jgi:hypothetical protein|nr:hypothetical protein [Kofleriaceae bacterium]